MKIARKKLVEIGRVVGGIRQLSCGHTMKQPQGGKATTATRAFCPVCNEGFVPTVVVKKTEADGSVSETRERVKCLTYAEVEELRLSKPNSQLLVDMMLASRPKQSHTYTCWMRLALGDGVCQCRGER